MIGIGPRSTAKALCGALRRVSRMRSLRRGLMRIVALSLVALAAAQGSAQAFAGWRCTTMEQRIFAPCCPDEGAPPPAESRIDHRCCERLVVPALAPATPQRRSVSSDGPAPGGAVALLPPALSLAFSDYFQPHFVPSRARPPDDAAAVSRTTIIQI